jgi:mRNA-degrading endonuclease RelE of RelBE toxin-antitoxin system
MSYELAIHPAAEKEWAKLDGSIKRRFKEKFAKERLENPRVELKMPCANYPIATKSKLLPRSFD